MYHACVCTIVARGEEVGRQVGRRLAAGLHHPGDGARIALAADQEDSPLQSKRSSRSSLDSISVFATCVSSLKLISFLLRYTPYLFFSVVLLHTLFHLSVAVCPFVLFILTVNH